MHKQYYLPHSGGRDPFNGMALRKRTNGRVFKTNEFIDLDEMRKLLVAGDPSDSDPGYEVPQRVNGVKCLELMSFMTI